MAIVIGKTGALRLLVAYVIPWPSGIYFYSRRVPADMKKYHQGKSMLRQSLKTRDPLVAAREAMKLAAGHDALWRSMRSPDAEEHGLTTPETRDAATAFLKAIGLAPGDARRGDELSRELAFDAFEGRLAKVIGSEYIAVRQHPDSRAEDILALLSPVQLEAQAQLFNHKTVVHLSDALEAYLRLKGRAADSKFAIDTTRSIKRVIDLVGDFPLDFYTRKHATETRDAFLAGGNKTATTRRRLNAIVAVINKALKEHGLDCKNHFAGLEIPNEDEDAVERIPFTPDELMQVAAAARMVGDDIRHIVSMQLDTGARAGEIIGLRINDMMLDGPAPYIKIRIDKKLGRTLKTLQSERDVPLIGEALCPLSKFGSFPLGDEGLWRHSCCIPNGRESG